MPQKWETGRKREACALILGKTYYKLGDFKKSIKYYTLCLQIVTELGDRSTEGRMSRNLATLIMVLVTLTIPYTSTNCV